MKWVEKPVEHSKEPPKGTALGSTEWKEPPTFATSIPCNGESKKWVGRVTSATGQQIQKIKPTEQELTDERIKGANCGTLRAMWDAMIAPLSEPGSLSAYAPRDLIQAHEDVHKSISSEDAARLAGVFIAAVTALSADCGNGTLSIEVGISLASGQFETEFLKAELKNKAHEPKKRFLDAHRPVCMAWLKKIRAEMVSKNCPDIPDMPQ